MDTPLLTTKLYLPMRREDIVHRPRLIERLNHGLWQADGFLRKLTLVSTAAGFGKTTLVTEWLPSLEQGSEERSGLHARVAWLSLEEEDNDPVRFLLYVIAALRQLWPQFGSRTEAILRLPQPPPRNIILTSLVNELADIPTLFILALDDYHAIHTPAIHEQLTFILEHQPARMHLVIATREDPLLPVSRLRAKEQLLEIRQDDLRFTLEETAEFLRRRTGLPLAAEEIAALERHTEGWVAGLQLVALSLRGRHDQAAFIRDLTDSDRYTLDYLGGEVFERQPLEVQDFLVQTSILKRLSGPLCEAVTGRSGSEEVLRNLEAANLFLVPLDPARTWYRYHHLFAELLQHRLRLSNMAIADLHHSASRWYAEHDLFQEAIEHALLAEDWGSACALIGQVNGGMLMRGETITLLGWFARLPQEVIYTDSDLCLTNAWAALLASRFELAAGLLEHVETIVSPGSPELGNLAAAQAFLARAQHDQAKATAKSEQALLWLPEIEYGLRGNVAMNLGLAYWHAGRISEAEPVLLQAVDLCGKSENILGLLTAQIFLARSAAARGKLHQAAAMSAKIIESGRGIPILCLAHYDLATIYNEWNDSTQAQEHFEQGFALSQRSGNLEFQQAGHLLRAILCWAQGDEIGALGALGEADLLAKDFPAAVRSRTAALGVQLALARNDPHMLSHWSARVEAEVEANSLYRFLGLTEARLLIAARNKDEAARQLQNLADSATRAGWGYGLLAIRLLQALAARSDGEAMPFIIEALRFGKTGGFLRTFVETGPALVPLLEEAAQRGIEPEYAGRILSVLNVRRRQEAYPPGELVEPLSDREIEVLRLIVAGLTNREIASRLVISSGTAKTHVHNLYGKLGVRNRTEAALRARELNLV